MDELVIPIIVNVARDLELKKCLANVVFAYVKARVDMNNVLCLNFKICYD